MRSIKLLLILCLFPAGHLLSQRIITLEDALEIAKQNSPDIQSSKLSLERSKQSLNAQRAALKSQFALTLDAINYNQRRTFEELVSTWYTSESFSSSGRFTITQPILWTDGTIALTDNFGWQRSKSSYGSAGEDKSFFNNLFISLNQPLFTYNTQRMSLKELELDLENTSLSYSMQELNLENRVTQYFYNVYVAQMNLSIARDELANTEKSFEITRNKVDAGLAAREELYQAELNYANAVSGVQNQEVTLENYKDQFKQYIGMDISEEVGIMTNIEANPVHVDLSKAIEFGLANRMELRQREINVETSLFSLVRTKAIREFKGSMNLSVGIIGEDSELQHIYDNPTRNPSVSLSFNIPIFDWGEKKSRIKAQEATVEQQHLALDQQKIQIEVDIRQVYRNLQNLLNQIEIARQSEKNAQLTYEINLERYSNGDLTGMDLNQFQTQLSTAKRSYAQSLINYRMELLNLKIQTLYDFEKGINIVPEIIIAKRY